MNIHPLDEKTKDDALDFELWTQVELVLFKEILEILHSSHNMHSTLSIPDVRKILNIELLNDSSDEELIYRLNRLNSFLLTFSFAHYSVCIYTKCKLSKGFFIQFQKVKNWETKSENIRNKINEELLTASKRKSILLIDVQNQIAEYYFSYKSLFIDNIFKYKNVIYEQVIEGIPIKVAFQKFKVRE